MKKTLFTSLMASLLLPNAMANEAFLPLTQSCEEALALSGLPEHLRATANVYVFKDGKFKQTISHPGGFSCLVDRNHPKAIIPQCISPNGTDEILPALKMRAETLYLGKSPAVVDEMIKQRSASGEIKHPTGYGVTYMMSNYNRIYNQKKDAIRTFPPHVMFFAPGIENEDIGGSFDLAMANKGFPFVAQPGAHRYILTMLEHSSSSSQVEAACRGQIEL